MNASCSLKIFSSVSECFTIYITLKKYFLPINSQQQSSAEVQRMPTIPFDEQLWVFRTCSTVRFPQRLFPQTFVHFSPQLSFSNWTNKFRVGTSQRKRKKILKLCENSQSFISFQTCCVKFGVWRVIFARVVRLLLADKRVRERSARLSLWRIIICWTTSTRTSSRVLRSCWRYGSLRSRTRISEKFPGSDTFHTKFSTRTSVCMLCKNYWSFRNIDFYPWR